MAGRYRGHPVSWLEQGVGGLFGLRAASFVHLGSLESNTSGIQNIQSTKTLLERKTVTQVWRNHKLIHKTSADLLVTAEINPFILSTALYPHRKLYL